MAVVFHLIGGPWDGQCLSTAAEDEANACFAEALFAITGGQRGQCVPLVSPSGQTRIDAGVGKQERQAIKPHRYLIDQSHREHDTLVVVARHVP